MMSVTASDLILNCLTLSVLCTLHSITICEYIYDMWEEIMNLVVEGVRSGDTTCCAHNDIKSVFINVTGTTYHRHRQCGLRSLFW